MAKERLSLYFDTDIPSERKMWEYICKDGKNRKSRNVKNALEMILEGVSIKSAVIDQSKYEKKYEKFESNIDEPKVRATDDNEGIEDDDLPF